MNIMALKQFLSLSKRLLEGDMGVPIILLLLLYQHSRDMSDSPFAEVVIHIMVVRQMHLL